MKRLFPLKWKLSISLVFLSLALVCLYIWIAKTTFENDKIAYVYSSDQERLEAIAKTFNMEFQKVVFNASTILAAYDPDSGSLLGPGQKVFRDDPALLSIEIWSPTEGKSLLLSEKEPNRMAQVLARLPAQTKNALEVRHEQEEAFLIYLRTKDNQGHPLEIRLIAKIDFPEAEDGASLLVVAQEGESIFPMALANEFRGFVRSLGKNTEQKTFAAEIEATRYLVSMATLESAHLSLISLTPEKQVLSALSTMYQRSLYFLLLSVFVTVAISMLLSSGLTRNIETLTGTIAQVERGDLAARSRIRSSDEISVLGAAFNKMLDQIQVLILETKEKSRMEAELQTARAVQDTLFPDQAFESSTCSIDGYYESASECGGDFWFYWASGNDLYFMIGDATGHGAPAALMTSALRSTISGVQFTKNKSLAQIVQLADASIRDSSKGLRLMTAFFAKLDITTHELEFINCSHEPALLIRAGTIEPIGLNPLARLGDQNAAPMQPLSERIRLETGDLFFLYTDGLSEISDIKGKRIRERVYIKLVTDTFKNEKFLQDAFRKIVAFLKSYSNMPLEDDMTMVALKIHRDGEKVTRRS